MKSMTEEKSYAEKKIRKLTENEQKEMAMHQKQVDFMKMMEDRYEQACKSVGAPVDAKIIENKAEGTYTVAMIQKPKPQTEEGQVFSLDHPELVPKQLTQEQFELLKRKVSSMCKSVRVDMKSTMIQTKRLTLEDKKAEENIKKLCRQLSSSRGFERRGQTLRTARG